MVYAELELYAALCPTMSSMSEGRFNEFFSAGKEVFESIDRAMMNSFNGKKWEKLDYDYGCYFNEKEARDFTKRLEENFESIETIIEPEFVMHGRICFHKKIRIQGYSQDQKEKLIAKIKELGLPFQEYHAEDFFRTYLHFIK